MLSGVEASLKTDSTFLKNDSLFKIKIKHKMINVIVTYTVKPEFVPENKINIQKFLDDFKNLNPETFEYKVYVKEDGITFLHYSNYINEEVQHEVLNVPSFKEFQRLRDESGLNGSHKVEILQTV
ncbi:hypothetical protein [Chryseobacterium gwangjuense]|jgi:hypothetical protein|uniref:hypothetical protein n=1 Tax=Chryseobacterium gwangjuense TaxID=1069980 RepID=UPI001E2F2241|nr:hypothetical protein [Chryseobacterium gwangjuense]MCE3076871.1 hypothetical protein [Chryseobacterium gwangjuense]